MQKGASSASAAAGGGAALRGGRSRRGARACAAPGHAPPAFCARSRGLCAPVTRKTVRLLTTAAPGSTHGGPTRRDCAGGAWGEVLRSFAQGAAVRGWALSLPARLIRAGVARHAAGGSKLWLLLTVPAEVASLSSTEPYRKK